MSNSNVTSKSTDVPRRSFLKTSTAACAGVLSGALGAAFLSCGKPETEQSESTQPNIIVVVADDTGWADVGYHGSEIKTPNIDRLAREGKELDQFYVYPVCSPTRAALMTGRPPSRYGILGPIAMRSTLALPTDTVTLAGLLGNWGYDTAITGKWHLGLRPEVGPDKYGFSHSYGYLHGQIDQYTHYYKNGDRSWYRNGEFLDEEGHATDLITNEAIRFIKNIRNKSKPFFLYVPYSVPHYPLQEEDRWTAPYTGTIDNESRRLYAASMTHMDDGIGRLVETLKDEGIENDTLVIFFSDNGGQEEWTPTFEYDGKFKPNDRLGSNLPLRDWKGSLYEGGVRAPALLYWPGRLKPEKVSTPAYVCDMLPTLAHVAGASLAYESMVEGINMWPALVDGIQPPERIFYWRTARQLAIRKGAWKLVHNGGTPDEGDVELFNILTDPGEKNNVSESNIPIVRELREELLRQFAMDNKL